MNFSSPEVTEGLLYHGLITQDQADEANRKWDKEFQRHLDDREWWWELADVAAKQYTSALERFWNGTTWWKYDWVRERRGW